MLKGIMTIGNRAEEVLCAVGRASTTDERFLELLPALGVRVRGVADGLACCVADQRLEVLVLSDNLLTGDACAQRHNLRQRQQAVSRASTAVAAQGVISPWPWRRTQQPA